MRQVLTPRSIYICLINITQKVDKIKTQKIKTKYNATSFDASRRMIFVPERKNIKHKL